LGSNFDAPTHKRIFPDISSVSCHKFSYYDQSWSRSTALVTYPLCLRRKKIAKNVRRKKSQVKSEKKEGKPMGKFKHEGYEKRGGGGRRGVK
jgi:hypothetical protein